MPYPTCDHLKEDGVYCSSPALRNQRYCYFHLNARARRVQAACAQLKAQPFSLHMPILDNQQSILAGIQQVLDALAAGRIPARQAAVFLFGLQQAAASFKSRPEWNGQRPELAADEPLSVLDVGTLQRRYRLPFDADLDGPPDEAAAEIDATRTLPLDARVGQLERPYFPRVPARPAPVPADAAVALAPPAPDTAPPLRKPPTPSPTIPNPTMTGAA
ncbi:MAG TPA: hypothetical protein VE779_11930 [Candidatus Angelobacter sp.]|nr:hypothetical protein [Candidatus Angelobacter sp.]